MTTSTITPATATSAIQARNDAHVLNTYGTRKLALARGEGVTLWDVDGKEYIDLFAGIAVCNLGHAHPKVTAAIADQAAKLLHTSNLYYIEAQSKLAEMLSDQCFADKWFFCNSGADANEACIKLARRYWAQQGTPRPHIITALQSFHGRTMATLSATGQDKVKDGFAPLLSGFSHVPYNDLDALADAIAPETGAIMIEPIQGEGGVRVPDEEYLQGVRNLCNEKSLLLIFDEVQTGMGRTGQLFAHQTFGVTPDIFSLAKALGNGVPIGAMGCTEEASKGFAVGSHATTFGGNPLSCAAAIATLDVMIEEGFLDHVRDVGGYFMEKLQKLAEDHPSIVEVRGRGLMIGIEFKEPVAPLVGNLVEAGLICGPAGPNTLRFVPPLILQREHVDRVMPILSTCVGELGW
jgi:acetylornithine aminotransferase